MYIASHFLVAQTVKNLSVMQETHLQSLGWEDPPEKGMATQLQYSCLGDGQKTESQRVVHD